MRTHQKLLIEKLAERKGRNSQFSLRSFSKIIGVSPGQLSALINGRKNLTPKLASRIISSLSLDENEAQDLLRGMLPGQADQSRQMEDLKVLSADEFRLIADWHHFAILSLSKIKNNKANGKWIAKRLQIDPTVAVESLNRLERLGLITISNGHFRQTSRPLTTTSDLPSAAIRSYHRQNLHLAEEKLETVPLEERIFSAITFATTPARISLAKKLITQFKTRICETLQTQDPTEVYTLSLQLFPVSHKE